MSQAEEEREREKKKKSENTSVKNVPQAKAMARFVQECRVVLENGFGVEPQTTILGQGKRISWRGKRRNAEQSSALFGRLLTPNENIERFANVLGRLRLFCHQIVVPLKVAITVGRQTSCFADADELLRHNFNVDVHLGVKRFEDVDCVGQSYIVNLVIPNRKRHSKSQLINLGFVSDSWIIYIFIFEIVY